MQSVFSGPIVVPVARIELIAQLTSEQLPCSCRPFLPSTKATLPDDEKMSTPKVGAMAGYFCGRKLSCKHKNSTGFRIHPSQYSTPPHIFFTETTHADVRISPNHISVLTNFSI